MVESIGCVRGCGKIRASRGLCGKCCAASRQDVKAGKTTWKKLEAAGLAVPAQTPEQRAKWTEVTEVVGRNWSDRS